MLCHSSIPLLGYSAAVLNDMEKAGIHLYKDGKREKPPRICRSGSGKQEKVTVIVTDQKGKVK